MLSDLVNIIFFEWLRRLSVKYNSTENKVRPYCVLEQG